MTHVKYATIVSLIVLCGAWARAPAHGQAAAIARPMDVADGVWIERQCDSIGRSEVTDDAAGLALQTAKNACETYTTSLRDRTSRDAWILTMLALQDNVGPGAMRGFVPEFGGQLPEGLDSYSLFLVPDARWRDGEFDNERAALWEAFYSFGRSIGDDHAAIWFLDQEDNVDVLRGQEYCRRFGLSYNDGPYVVFMDKRPDLLDGDDEIVVVRMGGIDPDRVGSVLNRLSQDLTTTGRVGTGGLVYEEIKQRVLTLVETYPEGARAFLSTFLGL